MSILRSDHLQYYDALDVPAVQCTCLLDYLFIYTDASEIAFSMHPCGEFHVQSVSCTGTSNDVMSSLRQPKHTMAHFRNHLRQNCVNIITLSWLPQQQQHNVCMHLPLQTRLINLANHCSCSHMAHLLSQASNWDADKGALLAYTCELMPCHMIRKDCT